MHKYIYIHAKFKRETLRLHVNKKSSTR